jgi:predicted SAM-dependent methyltransferase
LSKETINRIGAAGRRVPGVASLLDARLARRQRRLSGYDVEREQRRFHEATRGEGEHLRLNVGAGPSPVEGWLNVDLVPAGAALMMDATEHWPLPDDSAEAVNSEHFLEHIETDRAAFYFREAFRVLRPGGVIRTSTPDLRGLCEAYLSGDPVLLDTHRGHGYEARNHADMLNNYIYSWGHTHIYDFETIALMLEDAGFGRVERAAFGKSSHPILRGIDTHVVDELHDTVVAVDAVKPG